MENGEENKMLRVLLETICPFKTYVLFPTNMRVYLTIFPATLSQSILDLEASIERYYYFYILYGPLSRVWASTFCFVF